MNKLLLQRMKMKQLNNANPAFIHVKHAQAIHLAYPAHKIIFFMKIMETAYNLLINHAKMDIYFIKIN